MQREILNLEASINKGDIVKSLSILKGLDDSNTLIQLKLASTNSSLHLPRSLNSTQTEIMTLLIRQYDIKEQTARHLASTSNSLQEALSKL